MSNETNCPNCLASDLSVFYHVPRVPVHSVLLMETREKAVTYPKGDIALGLCRKCGFVSNTQFDASMQEYGGHCEETQGFSRTFQAFHRRLAASLVERYDLHGKKIIEIGCGKGEFLTLLCELGGNSGVGFDPAFVPERNPAGAGVRIEFIEDFYGEKYTDVAADFVCSKMTLEHIPDTARFLGTVRRSIGDRTGTPVFFQVPDVTRVLRDLAFWDIYYEHCSYFSAPSLVRLFEDAGFEVDNVWTDYNNQYLMITARAVSSSPRPYRLDRMSPETVSREVELFVEHQQERIATWRREICKRKARGERTVVWGSGSKGVAFLSALGLNGAIEYVVDINPFRHGKYMPGTGQQIVPPEFLAEYKPDVAIAMNPIYQAEIEFDLRRIGLPTVVWPVSS